MDAVFQVQHIGFADIAAIFDHIMAITRREYIHIRTGTAIKQIVAQSPV